MGLGGLWWFWGVNVKVDGRAVVLDGTTLAATKDAIRCLCVVFFLKKECEKK
jgi:hypothetical protein